MASGELLPLLICFVEAITHILYLSSSVRVGCLLLHKTWLSWALKKCCYCYCLTLQNSHPLLASRSCDSHKKQLGATLNAPSCILPITSCLGCFLCEILLLPALFTWILAMFGSQLPNYILRSFLRPSNTRAPSVSLRSTTYSTGIMNSAYCLQVTSLLAGIYLSHTRL